MRGALDFKVKDCPVCAVMKNKRPKKPTAVIIEQKRQWKPWEKVSSDSSGLFAVMSFQGNRYYSVFVCARSRRKMYLVHKKKSRYPLVYLKFLARIGRFPKLLVSDQAGEILPKVVGSRLAAQGTHIDTVPKDEHFKIGSFECAIHEIGRIVTPSVLDTNIPKCYCYIVGKHCTLLNAVTQRQSLPTDHGITTYEAETGLISDLDALPLLGYFGVRYLSKLDRKDFKLSSKNQACTRVSGVRYSQKWHLWAYSSNRR